MKKQMLSQASLRNSREAFLYRRKQLPFLMKQLAYNYDFYGCSYLLSHYIKKIPNDELLKLIDILRNVLFSYNKHFDMISFQRCCQLLHSHFQMSEKFIRVMAKLYTSNQKRAQKRLYFWWIPICYNPKSKCGQRMAMRSWERVSEWYNQIQL